MRYKLSGDRSAYHLAATTFCAGSISGYILSLVFCCLQAQWIFFEAYVSARGAISKLMMWQMSNTFATRFGPAPFSELVSEIQHRFHADRELMYFAAAVFYGQRGVTPFSAFDDPNGYAGSPPSVQYIKALFTDNLTAHRIYIERDIATLPLTVAKADHTFDVRNLNLLCYGFCLIQFLSSFSSTWVE